MVAVCDNGDDCTASVSFVLVVAVVIIGIEVSIGSICFVNELYSCNFHGKCCVVAAVVVVVVAVCVPAVADSAFTSAIDDDNDDDDAAAAVDLKN